MASSEIAFAQLLVQAVPFYKGLTLEQLGGPGTSWPERTEASALTAARQRSVGIPSSFARPADAPENGKLPIWAWPEVEISPALRFLVPHQRLELAPPDAPRLGIEHGETVEVVQEGARLPAAAHIRGGVPAGTAFLADGICEDSANVLTGSTIEIQRAAAPVGAR